MVNTDKSEAQKSRYLEGKRNILKKRALKKSIDGNTVAEKATNIQGNRLKGEKTMENGKAKVYNKFFYKQESLDQQVQSPKIYIPPYYVTPINISSCTQFSFSSNILNLGVLLPSTGRGGPGAARGYVPCRTCPAICARVARGAEPSCCARTAPRF